MYTLQLEHSDTGSHGTGKVHLFCEEVGFPSSAGPPCFEGGRELKSVVGGGRMDVNVI